MSVSSKDTQRTDNKTNILAVGQNGSWLLDKLQEKKRSFQAKTLSVRSRVQSHVHFLYITILLKSKVLKLSSKGDIFFFFLPIIFNFSPKNELINVMKSLTIIYSTITFFKTDSTHSVTMVNLEQKAVPEILCVILAKLCNCSAFQLLSC